MKQRNRGLFAGRGIALPAVKITLLTIAAAFVGGLLIGWFTTLLPGILNASAEPSASPSPSEELVPTPDASVSVPPLTKINRSLDEDDALAGVTTTDYIYQGEGTFTVVPGTTEPDLDGPPVRWVRVEVETGVVIDARTFGAFVMDALEDYRGWGAQGRLQFAQTDGAADMVIQLASPYTAAASCPDGHSSAELDGPTEVQGGAATDATPSPSPSALTCAQRGTMALSTYDWTAGLEKYDDTRGAARTYLVSHGMGHLIGQAEGICANGRALVMADQRTMPENCSINPWPHPDAPEPVAASPSPSPDAP